MQEKLFITVICPIFNECKYITSFIESILAQDYPRDKTEVFLIDGMSVDSTRKLVMSYAEKYDFIKILNNPEKIVPQALNIGIKASKGKIIIRMDAHSIYPLNYFSVLVDHLIQLNADNVGGVWNTLPANNTVICKSIAIASSHWFGVGNSLHKIGSKKIIKTDTVPFGCFKREIFDRIGFFDNDLVRNQDDEFNARIIRNGGNIYLIPSVIIDYYARDSISKMAQMYFQYGLFKPLVLYKVGLPATARQFFPLLFVLTLIAGTFLSAFSTSILWVMVQIIFLYFSLSIFFSLFEAIKKRKIFLLLFLPYTFLVIHLSYGWGYFVGIIKFLILRKKIYVAISR